MSDRNVSYQLLDVTDMAASRSRRPITLADLAVIPIRRWPVLLGLVLLGLSLASGYLLLPEPTFTATAVVVVRPVVTDPFALPSAGADRSVNMNVESGIAAGTGVTDAVAT